MLLVSYKRFSTVAFDTLCVVSKEKEGMILYGLMLLLFVSFY